MKKIATGNWNGKIQVKSEDLTVHGINVQDYIYKLPKAKRIEIPLNVAFKPSFVILEFDQFGPNNTFTTEYEFHEFIDSRVHYVNNDSDIKNNKRESHVRYLDELSEAYVEEITKDKVILNVYASNMIQYNYNGIYIYNCRWIAVE